MEQSKDAREMTTFLKAIVAAGGAASRKHVPLASRPQDRVRRKARKLGWVSYKAGQWIITEAGRKEMNA